MVEARWTMEAHEQEYVNFCLVLFSSAFAFIWCISWVSLMFSVVLVLAELVPTL